MPNKKMGRPTNNPKNKELTVRFDGETYDILEEYAKENNITRNEAVRIAVRALVKNKKQPVR